MKFFLPITFLLLLYHLPLAAQTQIQTHGPRCGLQHLKEAMIAKDSSWAARFEAQKAGMQSIANAYIANQQLHKAEKTAASISAVPVIFHIVVDSAQFYALGGTAGIIQRCDSQIAVLNRDYNGQNTDYSAIPSSWKALYGIPGIHFGLARKDPMYNCSPGYEIKIIPGNSTTDAGFSDEDNAFPEAKTASTGLAAWDVTRYYNVWCINFTGAAEGLLGLTQPMSFLTSTTMDQEGVCMLYNTLGCTAQDGTIPAGTGTWFFPYNLGRTLTHETGHFFEIWHPWGDDNGLCPWSNSNCGSTQGADDGLSDTPPQGNETYNNPVYSIPGGTFNDCCKYNGTVDTQPIGIACLSFLDYVDDDAMHMFTTMQAAAMASMVLVAPTTATGIDGSGTVGENYNLTQNPDLLVACDTIPQTKVSANIVISPNPATGLITISFNSAADTLSEITLFNIVGQRIMTIKGQNQDFYSIDLSELSKGIYFIKCNFVSGIITRKILLQ